MADDDVIDEEFEVDVDEDLDIDAEEFEDADLDIVDADDDDVDAVVVIDEDEEVAGEAPDAEPSPRGKKKPAGDEEVDDDDDVADPDDVEADLEEILRDRLAAADDDDEDETDNVDPRAPEARGGVTPKKANEFVCTGCFLLVNRGQFGPVDNMVCPVGESSCPAITKLRRAKR